MRGTELMKHYRLRWESIAFPDMGLTEIVEAETAKDAKVKAAKNSTDEFLSVYYLDEAENYHRGHELGNVIKPVFAARENKEDTEE